MPQPSLGAAARSKVVTVRVTQAQYDQLVAKGGTASKGAYAVLRDNLKTNVTRVADATEGRKEVTLSKEQAESVKAQIKATTKKDDLQKVADNAGTAHRHRRGEVVRSKFEQGQEVKVYACAVCGKEMS